MTWAVTSEAAFLQDVTGQNGLVAADRLSAVLRITRSELAVAVGVSRDAVAKSSRVVIPIALFADLIDGVDDPRIAGQGREAPGFVT